MRYRLLIQFLCFFCWSTLVGCAIQVSNAPVLKGEGSMPMVAKTFHSFSLDQCKPVPKVNGMVKKVDHFLMIFDPSASMTEPYAASSPCASCHQNFGDDSFAVSHVEAHGGGLVDAKDSSTVAQSCVGCHRDYLHTKFKFAKELALCLNKSIPEIDFVGSLRSFGSPIYTQVAYGPLPYDRSQYDLALQKIIDVDGASPLDQTLIHTTKDWFAAEGPMAVLIVSDGKDMGDEEVLAAKELVRRYVDRVCLYTVQIGNDDTGRDVLQKISTAGKCGGSLNGDTLLDSGKMTDFVRQVFLTSADASGDSDGDGVADVNDECPGTKPGTEVDERGCWKLVLMADVLFAFDRHDLMPEGMAVLDKVVDFLKENDPLTLEISGHTDNVGSQAYNEQLSRQRAMAGQAYLVSKGIAKERIKASWHSFNQPVASNETVEGRALNRRVEFKFSKPR